MERAPPLSLAEVIRTQREDILRRWLERVRGAGVPGGLTRPELVDHVPEFLDGLADTLEGEGQTKLRKNARQHGGQRYRVGFDVEAVIREFGHLQFAVMELAQGQLGTLPLEGVQQLTTVFAEAVAVAVKQFVKSQEEVLTRAQEHDRQQAAELRRALEARDGFLAVTTHELKTPLASLKLIVQSMIRQVAEGADPAEFRRRLSSAARQTDRLEQLVESLLDLARIRNAKLQLRPEPVQLGLLVQEVIESLRPQSASYECSLQLGRCDEVTIPLDRIRFEQVVSNLVSNAMKYGRCNPVHVSVERRGSQAEVVVRDGGEGIAADKLPRIFDPFERVHAGMVDGLGLGLYIARGIVEAHGGRIEVKSEPGEGSTFRVVLPALGGAPAQPA